MKSQKNFVVVITRLRSRFNDCEPELARVEAALKILPREILSMIPASSRRARQEGISALAVRRHRCRPLLQGSIDFGGQLQPMPVNKFGNVRIIENINADFFSLLHTQKGTGHRSVVADRLYRLTRS